MRAPHQRFCRYTSINPLVVFRETVLLLTAYLLDRKIELLVVSSTKYISHIISLFRQVVLFIYLYLLFSTHLKWYYNNFYLPP